MCAYRVLPKTQVIQFHYVTSTTRIFQSVNQKGGEAPTLNPLWVKNSNIYSQKTVIHLCAGVPHELPIREKGKTYSSLTHQQVQISQSVAYPNANIHRLLNPGTSCEKKISKTCALFQLHDALPIFMSLVTEEIPLEVTQDGQNRATNKLVASFKYIWVLASALDVDGRVSSTRLIQDVLSLAETERHLH